MSSISKTKNKMGLMLLWCCMAVLSTACGKGPIFGEDPKLQKYKDRTQMYLPDLKPGILNGQLAYVNRDSFPDLVLLRTGDRGQPIIRVWANAGGKKFVPVKRLGWEGEPSDQIVFMALQDVDHDRVQDLVLIGRFSDGSVAKLLFNNGKGYFYTKIGRAHV